MIKKYATEVFEFDLEEFGKIWYAQWLHPSEAKKSFSAAQVNELCKWIKPRTIAVDIGAHTGDTTLPIAVATRSGTTLAFEPNPVTRAVLNQNVALNPDLDIRVYNWAVMPESGMYTFHYSDDGYCNGGYALGTHKGIGICGHTFPLQVEGKNFQNWWSKRPFSNRKIGFIKIDTEGYDQKILLSLAEIISKDHPVLQVEVLPELDLDERKMLQTTISNLGYTSPRLAEILSTNSCFDLICTPV
jgi:FkbM family methyltransferase